MGTIKTAQDRSGRNITRKRKIGEPKDRGRGRKMVNETESTQNFVI